MQRCEQGVSRNGHGWLCALQANCPIYFSGKSFFFAFDAPRQPDDSGHGSSGRTQLTINGDTPAQFQILEYYSTLNGNRDVFANA